MGPLDGIRVVTTALNVPGPVACARLRALGASIAKVEPPEGDPLQGFARGWYDALHQGVETGRLDLKSDTGRRAMASMLASAGLLVTAQRPSALARMGLAPDALARRLAEKFALPELSVEALGKVFSAHDAEYWEAWGADNDLPIVALRDPSNVS